MRNITLLLLMLVFQQVVQASDPIKKNYPFVGDSVPAFTFDSGNGKIQSINDYKNKTVVLVFFATWCPSCRAELPLIQKDLWEKYGTNDQFKLLAIGRGHTKKELNQFMIENHFTFPAVPDSNREIFSIFAQQEIPRSYLLKDGKIVRILVGFNEGKFNKLKKQVGASLNTVPK